MVLEQVRLTSTPPLCCGPYQWFEEVFCLIRWTVVSVDSDQHIVLLGEGVRGLCKHDASVGCIVIRKSGRELSRSR